MRRKLRDYQFDALKYGVRVSYPALFMEMGLGKTLVAIRLCSYWFAKRILIVAPYSTFHGWQNELELEGEKPATEITGAGKKRIELLNINSKYSIISKEGHFVVPEIAYINWDVVILDESIFIKAPPRKLKKTKRHNTSRFYCRNFRHAKHRMILTGKPAPETPLEYFQQLQFLDPDILGFGSYWEFRLKCFFEAFHKYTMKANYKKVFVKRLAERCFFYSRKEACLAGLKIYQRRVVRFTPAMLKSYKKLAKQFILEYKDKIIKKTKFAPVKFIWLRQLCSGFINKNLRFKNKINELEDLIYGELKDKPVIIWCQFLCEMDAIHKKIPSKIINGSTPQKDRWWILNNFNKGYYDVLITHPACFKYGTDLSHAGTMIFFSSPLGLEARQQCEARITRGTKRDSLIIDMAVEGSVEEEILDSLLKKEGQSRTIERMVKHLQEVT